MSNDKMHPLPELLLERSVVHELTGTEGYSLWPEHIRYIPEASLLAERERCRREVQEARADSAPKSMLRKLVENARVTESGCIELKLGIDHGYATIYGRKAHRAIWEWLYGPIGDLVIDHLCRNKCCVNPEHLEPVTSKENSLRGIGPTAVNAKKEVCDMGHALRGDVCRQAATGWRHCRICRSARQFLSRGSIVIRHGRKMRAALKEQRAFLLESGTDVSEDRIYWEALEAHRAARPAPGSEDAGGGE